MRILVVEDEHRIATSIKSGLVQERHTVDLAFRGDDGYDLASENSYELIILDRMLPGLDGLDVCRKLRSKNIHTPILILTAKSRTADKIEGLDGGADDYLTKPFSFEELLARIRALSRRPEKSVNNELKISDLSLDSKTFKVYRKSKAIELSKKEFSVLEFLMKNANKVISKEQLIENVWDYDADILPNTIEVNIRNLRNKIEKPFKDAKSLIKTVRGFGYKVEE